MQTHRGRLKHIQTKVKIEVADRPNKLITIKDRHVRKFVNRILLRHCPDLWHDVIIPGLDGDGAEVRPRSDLRIHGQPLRS